MRRINERFLKHPYRATRSLTEWLKEEGYDVNRQRIQELHRKMNLEAIFPKPDLSKPEKGNTEIPICYEDNCASQRWFRFYNHDRHHQTLRHQKSVQRYRHAT
ncbi:MAG TPA: hypothetical protein VG605_01835 [Puia sp.]|nr:hypothetical protein [Puia sp.]